MRADLTVAGSPVANARTIWRMTRKADGSFNDDLSSGWRADAGLVSIAKAQINDDKTDRTFIADNTGAQPMRVIDATGENRRAGVPQPSTPPSVTVTVVDEITNEERASGYAAAVEQATQVIQRCLVEKWVGVPRPGVGMPGLIDISLTHLPAEDKGRVGRVYRLSGAGGTITDTYSGQPGEVLTWVMDPMLKGQEVPPFTNSPAWAGGHRHYGVGLAAYGMAYELDVAAATAALSAIEMPGGEKLLQAADVTAVCASIQIALDDSQGLARAKKEALTTKFNEVVALFAGGARSNLIAATTAFYARPAVSAAIDEAMEAFASEVFKNAKQVFLTPIPTPPYETGGAP